MSTHGYEYHEVRGKLKPSLIVSTGSNDHLVGRRHVSYPQTGAILTFPP